MRPVLAIAALGVLLIGSLAACSDDDPLRLSDGDRASFSLQPQLNQFGASQMLPINTIRLTVVSLPDSAEVMEPEEFTVAPNDPSWDLHLDVPLIGGNPIDVLVYVELINVTDGVRTVEWSGIAGPFSLQPGRTAEPPVVDLFRGSLDNLSITAVSIDVDAEISLLEGDSVVLRALAQGATATPQFFWSSLQETIAALDTAQADSAVFHALFPGLARIVVEAGQHADTLELTINPRVTQLLIAAAADTIDALGAEVDFVATALDARGEPVGNITVDWTSSDSLIARSIGGGRFRAVAVGDVVVGASSPSAPSLTPTATLHVRQVVASVDIGTATDEIPAGQTRALVATARDATAHVIPATTFAWTSDDATIASVDATGLVTAARVGTTRIRATANGIQDSASIVVTPGAVATVVASEDSLFFGALNESVTLTATVTDAQGNPTGTPVTWTSDSEGVATVTAGGRVDAAGNGDGWIIATAGGVADSVHVDVQQIPVAVDVTIDQTTILAGSTTAARAVVNDAGGDSIRNATFTWSSSDASIAGVDAAGVVTGANAGTAWIVAAHFGLRDSVQVEVTGGTGSITWLGGAAGAETDWFTPANWSPARVPTDTDTVLIPSTLHDPTLGGAEFVGIASLFVDSDATLDLRSATLTVHGSVVAQGDIVTAGTGSIVKDGEGAIQGTMPHVFMSANTYAQGAFFPASLTVAGASMAPQGYTLTTAGDLIVNNGGSLVLTGGDHVTIGGRTLFLNAATENTLDGGFITALGEFRAEGCGSFVSTGTDVTLGGPVQAIYVECSALDGGNRFDRLVVQSGVDQLVFVHSDLAAQELEVPVAAGSMRIAAFEAQPVITTHALNAFDVVFEGVRIEMRTSDPFAALEMGDVSFQGFSGVTEPQLIVEHPGFGEPVTITVNFDAASAGAYLEAWDADAVEDVLELHVLSAATDGPARTSTFNAAQVWWRGQPYSVDVSSGNGQSATESTQLPQPVTVRVEDVFGDPIAGVSPVWTVTQGGGFVSSDTSTTNASGLVSRFWTLGAAFTPQELVAAVAGAHTSATFTATSISSAPGATVTWIGTDDDQWGRGANWSTGNVPGVTDTVYIPAGAPNQPRVHGPSQVSGVIIEPGATINTETEFTIGDYLLGDGPITGFGFVRFLDAEVRHTDSEGVVQVPSVQVSGNTFLWNRVNADFVHVLAGGYLELTFGGLETTGNVIVDGDDAQLFAWDSLIVHGSLTVGGNETSAVAYLSNHSDIVVDNDLLVTGRGLVEFADQDYTIRVLGDARWESVMAGEGIMPAGTMYVGGDWHQEGPSFHSPELLVVFDGTSGQQTITNLTPGHDAGEGHFGAVHVTNPSGVHFVGRHLIRTELSSDPGVPIVADSIMIEEQLNAGGDFTADGVTAAEMNVAGVFNARIAAYVAPYPMEGPLVVNGSLPYRILNISTDSAVIDGPVTVDNQLIVGPATIDGRLFPGGWVRLGGRTVADSVFINAGTLDLGGHTLDASAGMVVIGNVTATGLLTMDAPTDSVLATEVWFFGSPSAGTLTDGTILSRSFYANGTAFNASGDHRVVLDGSSIGTVSTTAPSLDDGVGSRFATLELLDTSDGHLALATSVAASFLVIDEAGGSNAQVFAAVGQARALMADSVRIDGALLGNVPLVVAGGLNANGVSGPTSIGNVTFANFDAGLTQLDIARTASLAPFVFTGMTFDPIPDVSTDGSLYVSASRVGSMVDANLVIDIDDTNVDNGEAFTADDDATADVRWVNDPLPVPPPATIAWIGTTSDVWSEPTNWNTGSAPTGADTVHVFAAALNQPTVYAPDSIAGIILEPGASVTLAEVNLVVLDHVVAGNTIGGVGAIRMYGGTLSGTIPNLQVAGSVAISGATTIDGDVSYVEDFAELHVAAPTTVTGSVFATGEASFLHVGDVLDVAGAVEVGAAAVTAVPEIEVAGSLLVGQSLTTTGNGRIEMMLPTAVIDVEGNAAFESSTSSQPYMDEGELRVGGDLTAIGGALHMSSMRLVLDGAGDQHVQTTDPGQASTQSRLYDVSVEKSGGTVYLESDVLVFGTLDELTGFALLDVAQQHTLTVHGDIDVAGDIMVDSLRFGGTNLNVGASLSTNTTEFFGSSQTIPGAYGFQNVLVSGSATFNSGVILGNLDVAGDLSLAGPMNVEGVTTVTGRLDLNGQQTTLDSLDVLGGAGIVMEDPADQLNLVRSGFFAGGTSTLSAGTLFGEPGSEIVTVDDAFVSTGTLLRMRGELLDMSNAGPDPGQGRLTDLVLETPLLALDSVYVTGDVTELAAGAVVDIAGDDPWRAKLHVLGSIVTPSVDYFIEHISVGGDLQLDVMDVDTVEFTGDGQTARVVDALSQPIDYRTILITGPNVSIGDGGASVALTADVVVRGAGVTANLISAGSGSIGSLEIVEGDAATSVSFFGSGWTVDDSVVVESGSLLLQDQVVEVNTTGSAPIGFRTGGTGVLQMMSPSAVLDVAQGNLLFEGGSTDGLLTDGVIHTHGGSVFRSVGDAFRSTGTTLVLRGDTIDMIDSGPDAGQGQLVNLDISKVGFIEVLDSLYVTGNLTDVRIGGSGLHDSGDDALVTVLGDATFNGDQVVIDHFAVGGQLTLQAGTTWVVDTTEFRGVNQAAPARNAADVPITYGNILITGSNVDLGFDGSLSEQINLPNSDLIVRGPGSSVRIHNNDGDAELGSLLMENGDGSQSVTLMASLALSDSVHLESGLLDLNDMGLRVNTNGVVPNGLTVTGTGVLVMDGSFDLVDVIHGPATFTSTQPSILSGGSMELAGDFYSENDAFRSTGTHVQFAGSRLEMVNGGPLATQGGFQSVHIPSDGVNPTFAGSIHLSGNLTDARDGTLAITSDPGTTLELAALDLTSGSDLTLSKLIVHDSITSFFGGLYDVDVTEYAGSGQQISRTLTFDTLVVSGSASRTRDFEIADTIARVVLVHGELTMFPGNGSQIMIADSLVVDGDGSSFDLNGANLIVGSGGLSDGGLVTSNGGVLVSKIFGWLSLNGSATFTGGSTEELLTDGYFYFGGDFYAENGAFQASGNHVSDIIGGAAFLNRIVMPTAGAGPGTDHFNDLALSAQNEIAIDTDVYVIGDLSDYFDGTSSTVLTTERGATIWAEGWQIGSGITVNNVTMALDDDIDPLRSVDPQFDNVIFADYGLTEATRLFIRHAGVSRVFQFNDVSFADSEGYPGAYVHAIDSDGVDPPLGILFWSPNVTVPSDAMELERTVLEGGAQVQYNQ